MKSRFLLSVLLALGVVVATCNLSAAEATSAITTVDELWAGYDPRAVPLDIKVLKETVADGLVLRTVQYTSETTEGFTVRMLAYYGFPKGAKKLPAVLHIHGGGQNATLPYVKYWASHGYAALSIDWGGKPLENKEENGKTDWGKLPYNQNSDDTGSVYNMTPNARFNSWYHWAIAARRSITFLEQQPEVDPAHIGVFGVSMGGRLTWLVAGTDRRIRCATSVVGATLMDEPIPGIEKSAYVPTLQGNATWRAVLDAYAYASHITCPFFYLSASDDFYGRVDNSDRSLNAIPGDQHWRSFTPHFSHHIGSEEAPALASFMDHWLKDGPAWPHEPTVALRLDTPDHVPLGRVSAPGAGVRRVALHYSTGIFPQARFWRTVEATKTGDAWTAPLPLTELGASVLVYAGVTYDSGLVLSTPIAHATPADLKAAAVVASDAPSQIIDDFHAGPVDWFVTEAAPNVLLSERAFFKPAKMADGGPAFTFGETASGGWRAFTRKVGDPKWHAPDGAGVQFEVNSEKANSITVVVEENHESWPWPSRVFAATAHLTGGQWEHVSLPMPAFHDVFNGQPLASWKGVNLLGVVGSYNFSGGHMHLPNKQIGVAWDGAPPALGRIGWAP